MRSAPPNSERGVKFVLRALRYRNYRLFFGGQGISLVGTWMQRIAMSWLVYSLTGSAFLLGLVGFAGMLPTFLITPFAGVLIDRWNRHRVIVVTQILALLQALVLSLLVLTGTMNAANATWMILALSIFLGVVNAFDMPARQSFVVDMVERREDLGNAIALNSSLFNGARLIGPTVAGIVIAVVGEGFCFLLNAVSYIAVIVALLAMRLPPRAPQPPRRHVLHELVEGFRHAFGFPPIRTLLLLVGFVSLVGMPYAVLMPVFATQVFGGNAQTLGYLMGAGGIGALIGAVHLASRRSVLGLGRMLAVGTGVAGLSLVAFAYADQLWLGLMLMVAAGWGMMVQMASANTILQTLVDDDKRGRVMALYAMTFAGMAPFGSLLAGGLADAVGAPLTVLFTGLGCLAAATLFTLNLPSLRRQSGPIYVVRGILPAVTGDLTGHGQVPNPPEK